MLNLDIVYLLLLPQIFLQSVFIIRSANDIELRKGSNIYLILLSTIASLFSICSKWAHIDKLFIIREKAHNIKLDCCKFPNPFPYFVNPWYIARIMWRLCHFLSSFSVLVLIWAVMGGWFALFWMIIAFFTWWIVLIRVKTRVSYFYFDEWMRVWAIRRKRRCALVPCVAMHGIGITMYRKGGYIYVFKVCQTFIGMGLITLFGMIKFDCVICADTIQRQIFNNENERIFIFWIIGCISMILDIIFFMICYYGKIIKEEREFSTPYTFENDSKVVIWSSPGATILRSKSKTGRVLDQGMFVFN